jgi:colanic acid/amylovoran biosynthesis glycosyltransferase
LEKNVQFLGVISVEEFKKELSQSAAFVQHSVRASNGDMEGTPVSIMEAGLAGIPVISTYHAGISDVIVHNKTGLLCKEHDVDGMAKHMIKVLDNLDFAKTLGANNRLRIKEHFSLEQHINLLQKTLESSAIKN